MKRLLFLLMAMMLMCALAISLASCDSSKDDAPDTDGAPITNIKTTPDEAFQFIFREDQTYAVRLRNDWKNTAEIKIPASYNGIAVTAVKGFGNNPNLRAVEIPKSVTLIDYNAFENCPELSTVLLHEGLMEIGKNAFAGCSNLKYITLPSTLIMLVTTALRTALP